MKLIIAWIVAFIVAKAPPGRPQYIPEARETIEEATARYESIAHDIAEVVYDSSEAPLFRGPDGRARTAAVIQSVMLYESGFRKDVDLGQGRQSKGDGGRSWCMLQIQLGQARANGRTQQRIILQPDGMYHFAHDGLTGIGGEDLVRDRKICIRAGLHMMRKSFTSCTRGPVEHRLSLYASGECDRGQAESAKRMSSALRWFQSHKPEFTDAEILRGPSPSPEPDDQPVTLSLND